MHPQTEAHTPSVFEDDAMSLKRSVSAISIALGSVAAVSSAADSTAPGDRQSALPPALYIAQAESLNTADKSVVRVNAKVEQEFEIIHFVSAHLTPRHRAVLPGGLASKPPTQPLSQ